MALECLVFYPVLCQVPFVPQAPGPPGGWQAWAQAVMQRLPGLSNMLLSEHEVCGYLPAVHDVVCCRRRSVCQMQCGPPAMWRS
jgi:hypothetical protein